MSIRHPILLAGILGPALGLAWGNSNISAALIWGLGCLIGWILARYRFGFSGPIRRTIQHRDPNAIYPIASLVFALIVGSAVIISVVRTFGLTLDLAEAPLRPSLVAGAFLFGIGMQMAGRCGSGTLASAATPDGRFASTLGGLIIGAFGASLHRPTIEQFTPAGIEPISLLKLTPIWIAVVIQLSILGVLLIVLNLWCCNSWKLRSRDQHNRVNPTQIKAGLGLSIAMLVFLVVAGETWKVLWGLAISGAHLAQSLSWDPASSAFWSAPRRLNLLASPANWIQQRAVLVNLGVIYGAFVAGFWNRRTETKPNQTDEPLLPYATGGVLMGYGGFLSYGCNISSFLGGVMSFSLHGWAWIIAAFLGSMTWLKLIESSMLKKLLRQLQ